jgi:autotransporter-associated beta strand protein
MIDPGTWDWAVHDSVTGVGAVATYETSDEGAGWTSNKNVRVSSDQTLTASRTINSLNIRNNTNATVTIGSPYTLTLASGGLMVRDSRPNVSSIPPGSWLGSPLDFRIAGDGNLTVGTAGTGELFVNTVGTHTYNWQSTSSIWTMWTKLLIAASIVDGPASTVTLVKSGSGTLTLGAQNTFSGGIVVNSGTLRLSNTNSNVAFATVAPGAELELNHANALPRTLWLTLEHYGANYGMVDLKKDATAMYLQLNDEYQLKGPYNRTSHPDWFTGPGTLTVLRDCPPKGTVIMLL